MNYKYLLSFKKPWEILGYLGHPFMLLDFSFPFMHWGGPPRIGLCTSCPCTTFMESDSEIFDNVKLDDVTLPVSRFRTSWTPHSSTEQLWKSQCLMRNFAWSRKPRQHDSAPEALQLRGVYSVQCVCELKALNIRGHHVLPCSANDLRPAVSVQILQIRYNLLGRVFSVLRCLPGEIYTILGYSEYKC